MYQNAVGGRGGEIVDDLQSQKSHTTKSCPVPRNFSCPSGHFTHKPKVFFWFSYGFLGFTWISRIQLLCRLRKDCTLQCSELYQEYFTIRKSHGQPHQLSQYLSWQPAPLGYSAFTASMSTHKYSYLALNSHCKYKETVPTISSVAHFF